MNLVGDQILEGQDPPFFVKYIIGNSFSANLSSLLLHLGIWAMNTRKTDWKTRHVGIIILPVLGQHEPLLTPSGLLRLEFQEEGDKDMPLVWVTALTLQNVQFSMI